MFTGIVEETGQIVSVEKGRHSSRLTIKGDVIFDDLKLGDSVAVNGVCLTVSTLGKKSFTADVMSETLKRSTLGKLTFGSKVNLERALPAWGRFGGHIVSGHIDGTGVLAKIREDDNARWLTIEAPSRILRYMIQKGSICIDGVSLTLVSVYERCFEVSMIPHTAKITTLLDKKIGDPVNLENDVIGKYIERFLQQPGSGPVPGTSKDLVREASGGITEEFLREAGF